MRVAREHPVSIGLIGAGLAWFVIEQRRRAAGEAWTTAAPHEGGYEDVASVAGGVYGATGAGERTGLKRQAQDAVLRAKGALADAGARVRDVASHTGRRVSDIAGTVRERAVDLGRRTSRGARQANDGFWDLVERRPMAAGVGTLAAGMLIGFLIPSTRREDGWMGETRDQLLRGARDAGRQTLDRAEAVVRSASDAATLAASAEARRQELTSEPSF